MTPCLSILIPTIPARLSTAVGLYRRLQQLMEGHEVEILLFGDNKYRTIGEKREAMKNLATGDYFCFCDDDDKVGDNYVKLAEATKEGKDIITFKQHAIIDTWECYVDFDISHKENEPFQPGEIIHRRPFHVCAFRRELVQDIPFPPTMYGEDWAFCEPALKRVKTQTKIDEVIHTYIFNTHTTAAK